MVCGSTQSLTYDFAGAVVPGTTKCELQPCTAAACCERAANTWSVEVSEFSEWAVGLERCTEVAASTAHRAG